MHRRISSHFRLAPFKGVQGNSASVFKLENVQKEISPMIEHLFSVLNSLVYPSVRSEKFSLVNVTNPRTNNSVGYQEAPHPDVLMPNTGLAFTFSLTPRPLVKKPKQVFTIGGSDYAVHWGTKKLQTNEYVTLCLTDDVLKDWDINYSMIPDLIYVYNVIGIVTKSFVLDSSWYSETGYAHRHSKSREVLSAQYNEPSLKRLMDTRPFNAWVHNKDVWLRASNLLHANHLYRDFGLFFAHEIFDWVKTATLTFNAKEYVYGGDIDGFPKYIERGIRDLKQFIRGADTFTSEMEAVVCLLYLLVGEDVPVYDLDALMGLRQFERMPVVLGDAEHAARELINQTDYLVEIAEVLR